MSSKHMLRGTWAIAVVATVVAACLFTVRGPWRGWQADNLDFALIYSSARGWAGGHNPYDGAALDAVWRDAGGPEAHRPTERGRHDLLYPPPSFVLLAPFAAPAWPVARGIWLAVNVVMFLGAVWGMVRLAGLSWRTPHAWFAAAAALALAPAHTGLFVGQTAIAVTCLLIGGHVARRRGHEIAAGCLLGFAAVLKPQVGGLYLCYELLRRRWRVVLAGGILGVVVAIVGVARLEVAGIEWLDALRENVRFFSIEGDGDPTQANPYAYQLINLHHLLHVATDDRTLVSTLVLVVLGLLVFGFGLAARFSTSGVEGAAADAGERPVHDELPAHVMMAVISLLAVYHRSYDAVLLMYALAWSVRGIRDRVGAAPWLMLIAVGAFWTPGGPLFHEKSPLVGALMRMEIVASATTDAWWWKTFVLPIHVWALLAIGVLAIWARTVGRKTVE